MCYDKPNRSVSSLSTGSGWTVFHGFDNEHLAGLGCRIEVEISIASPRPNGDAGHRALVTRCCKRGIVLPCRVSHANNVNVVRTIQYDAYVDRVGGSGR